MSERGPDFRIGVMYGELPEVVDAALPIVKRVGEIANVDIELVPIPVSGEAYDLFDEHLPQSSIETAREMDAVIKGPFGGPPNSDDPKWQNLETNAILPLRTDLGEDNDGLYANLRQVKVQGRFGRFFSPLRSKVVKGTDIMFVRELTGGIYFGKSGSYDGDDGEKHYYEMEDYTEAQVERLIRRGIEVARQRGDKLTLVHKTNVLTETGALWKSVFDRLVAEEEDLEADYMHVDAMAAALLKRPKDFGTIVTTNMFGDILSDEGAEITGSLGIGGSASLGNGTFGLYEPIHGSAPDIKGQDKANPIGTILSTALMFRHSLGLSDAADMIEDSVAKVVNPHLFRRGRVTEDLYDQANVFQRLMLRKTSTSQIGNLILKRINKQAKKIERDIQAAFI